MFNRCDKINLYLINYKLSKNLYLRILGKLLIQSIIITSQKKQYYLFLKKIISMLKKFTQKTLILFKIKMLMLILQTIQINWGLKQNISPNYAYLAPFRGLKRPERENKIQTSQKK